MDCPQIKKRKIDKECRQFNENWTEDYFFIPVKDKPVCMICSQSVAVIKEYNIKRHYNSKHSVKFDGITGQIRKDITANLKEIFSRHQTLGLDVNVKGRLNEEAENSCQRASFAVGKIIACSLRPFSDGEFIKECLDEITDIMCPENKELFSNIDLSRSTVTNIISKMADNIEGNLRNFAHSFESFSIYLEELADGPHGSNTIQLGMFICGVDSSFNIIQDMLKLTSLEGPTTDRDLLVELKDSLQKYNLDLVKLSGLITNGNPALKEKNDGLIFLLKEELKKLGLESELIFCSIYHECSCLKWLQMNHVLLVIVSIINFMQPFALYHKQFKRLLEDISSEYSWQSSAKILQQFYNLRQEIKFFMEMKGRPVPELSSEEWLLDLAFLVDITGHLNELNAKLMGKSQLANDTLNHMKSFQAKLQLWESQLLKSNSAHFSNLYNHIAGTNCCDFTKYAEKIKIIRNEFHERFSDFAAHEKDLRIFASPFNIEAETVPEYLQMEIIELQCNSELKYKFQEVPIILFYKLYLSRKTYPNLYSHALKMASIFTSTSICEKYFSKMKSLKRKDQFSLSVSQIEKKLRVAISGMKIDIPELIKDK